MLEIQDNLYRVHSAEPEMIFVEGGTFWMGCTIEQEESCDSDESPLNRITLNSFQIGKYVITQAQWDLMMSNNPSLFKGDCLPVGNVSWDNVQEFINHLNVATGKQYRLPTEAEWEYAARGGNKSQGYKYSGSHNLDNVGWFKDNSGDTTHQVGGKKPNELGIFDMSGNVWEWCMDLYGSYSASDQQNYLDFFSDPCHVLRGGSWYCPALRCRVTYRDADKPDKFHGSYGFRLVLSDVKK
ncbi:MAG: formylglycine-generating enzyme family protein [Bacteroidales bacterium]|jgi:formylglycine-generating enzyme required for sulfatase activity|nr:formylglycine-generating enzyme family protein [Bacteroidales bacterium]